MWTEDLFVLFIINHLTDNSEVQDLKECLAVEQEEKNELNRKIQNLEKECKADFIPMSLFCSIAVYCYILSIFWSYIA